MSSFVTELENPLKNTKDQRQQIWRTMVGNEIKPHFNTNMLATGTSYGTKDSNAVKLDIKQNQITYHLNTNCMRVEINLTEDKVRT